MKEAVNRKMNLLLVEGMPELSERIRRIIATSAFASRVHTVGDSAETLAYLRHEPPYRTAPKPDIVLLGLSQARSDRRDIADEIAGNSRLVGIEVVTLEDPRLRQIFADDPILAPDGYALETIELPALGQYIDKFASVSPHFARTMGAL